MITERRLPLGEEAVGQTAVRLRLPPGAEATDRIEGSLHLPPEEEAADRIGDSPHLPQGEEAAGRNWRCVQMMRRKPTAPTTRVHRYGRLE